MSAENTRRWMLGILESFLTHVDGAENEILALIRKLSDPAVKFKPAKKR